MKYKQFGRTGENVFVLGLGTYGHGEAYGGISKKESHEIFSYIINHLPDSAKFLVDAAPRYGSGKVEEWIGQFIKELGKNKILIATKGGRHIETCRINEKNFSHDFLKEDLEKSLTRLDVDKIFLYQLHNPSLEIIKEGSTFELLERFKDERKIRFYGVSIDNPKEGIAAINVCEQRGYKNLTSIQVVYNILNKKADKELFEKARDCNIAIIAREALLRGFLADKYNKNTNFSKVAPAVKKEIDLYGKEQILLKVEEIKKIVKESGLNIPLAQVAIKFVISNPYITLAIPGINRLEYAEPDLNAADIQLGERILSELRNIEDLVEQY